MATSSSGLVYTASDAATQLYNTNRDYNNNLTWQSLYNSNTLAGSKAVSQLQNSYTDATTQAYISYLQNKNALASSGIVGSGRTSAMQAYDTSLQSTLADYSSSLSEGVSSINTAVSENATSITEALQEQAQYTADYTNAHYSYLEELYNQYLEGENTLFDSDNWSKYLIQDALLDENGNEQYDEEGKLIYDPSSTRLKTWSELSDVAQDENGEYTSLLDENGNLTRAGVDYFDQLENDLANSGGYSWNDYLLENNEELHDWANSYNYYNYTQAGTNAGSVKTMYGMMSTDATYSYLERMGGMTSSQIDETFSDFTSKLEDIENISDLKGSKVLDSVTEAFSSLNDILTDLGIDKDFEQETGISISDYLNTLSEYSDQLDYYNDGSYTWTTVADFCASVAEGAVVGAGIGASVGAAAGATAGSALPLAGTLAGGIGGGTLGGIVGAVAGGIAGLVTGIFNIVDRTKEKNNANKEYSQAMKQLYLQALTQLTEYTNSNNVSIIY